MYSVGLYLIENTNMDIDWGAFVAALVAVAGLIGIYIKMQISLKQIEIRQENQDSRITILEDMVKEQITVDNGIKDVLSQIQIGQATMNEQVKNLIERLDRAV